MLRCRDERQVEVGAAEARRDAETRAADGAFPELSRGRLGFKGARLLVQGEALVAGGNRTPGARNKWDQGGGGGGSSTARTMRGCGRFSC